MNKPLSILLVEDDDRDALLIARELRQAGYDAQCRRVDRLEDFLSASVERAPDLIFCDSGLPGWDGVAVLALARQRCPGSPFIFLTGTVTNRLQQSGANACVQKDRMRSDLIPAIESALPRKGPSVHGPTQSWMTMYRNRWHASNGSPEPDLAEIKSRLAGALETEGEARIPLKVLRQAWARDDGRVLFFAKPKLQALADELHCGYELDEVGVTTTFRSPQPR